MSGVSCTPDGPTAALAGHNSSVATVQDAFAAAMHDPAASDRLWSDPERFGRDVGLRGAALAELVGAIRFGIRGREEGKSSLEVVRAATRAERGQPWPFAVIPDNELTTFVALTERCTAMAGKSRGPLARDRDSALRASFVAWARALLDEATRRAEESPRVSAEVADAIVAAKNLLGACDETDEADL